MSTSSSTTTSTGTSVASSVEACPFEEALSAFITNVSTDSSSFLHSKELNNLVRRVKEIMDSEQDFDDVLANESVDLLASMKGILNKRIGDEIHYAMYNQFGDHLKNLLNIVFEPLQKGGSIKDAKKKVEEKVPTVTSPQPTNTDSMWRPYDNSTVDEINEIFRINQVEGFEYMVVGIDEETQERAVFAERDIPLLAYQNMKYSDCVVTQEEYNENPDKYAEFYAASNEDKTKPMVYTLRKDETNTPCSLAPF